VTESRAQAAEERALRAESALVDALERLRGLEQGRSPVSSPFTPSVPQTPSQTVQSTRVSQKDTGHIASISSASARDKSTLRTSAKVKTKKK